jgi:hypothetical protein
MHSGAHGGFQNFSDARISRPGFGSASEVAASMAHN